MLEKRMNALIALILSIFVIVPPRVESQESTFEILQREFGDGEFSGAMGVQHRRHCQDLTKPVRKTHFLSPKPSESAQSRFRGFGEPCDPAKEEEFWKDALRVYRTTPEELVGQNGTDLKISPTYLVQEWNRVWTKHSNLNSTCNPRWLLECDTTEKRCKCRTTGLGERLPERENVTRSNCPSALNCAEGVGATHRCVGRMGVSCELWMPPIGLCLSNCQMELECTGVGNEAGDRDEDLGALSCRNTIGDDGDGDVAALTLVHNPLIATLLLLPYLQ